MERDTLKKFNFWRSKNFWQIVSINGIIIFCLFMLLMFSSHKLLVQYLTNHYQERMDNVTDRLETQITQKTSDIESITRFIARNINSDMEINSLQSTIEDLTTYGSIVDGIVVTDSDGHQIASYIDKLDINFNKLTDDLDPIDDKLMMKQSSDQRDNQYIQYSKLVGGNTEEQRWVHLFLDVNNDAFQSIFQSLDFVEDSYTAILSDDDVLFRYNNLNQHEIEFINQLEEQIIANDATKTQKLDISTYDHFYSSQQSIPKFDWRIVMVLPSSDITALSYQLNKILIPIFIILSILLFIIVTISVQQQLRPLNKLFKAIEEISDGHYNHRIRDIDNKSTIGSINAKFNVMANKLDNYRGDIKHKTDQLKQQKNFLNRIINHNPNGIYTMNWEGEFTLVNKVYADLFGKTPEEILGKKEIEFNPNHEEALYYLDLNRKIIRSNQVHEIEDFLFDDKGNKHWFHVGKVPILGDDGEQTQLLCVITDITEQKEKEALIKRQAYYDDLTDIPNRYMYKDKLRQIIEQSEKKNKKFALLFLDLDRFKYINDTFGHEAGDTLLQTVASRLQNILPKSATVFRFGGDEFIILFPNIEGRQEVADLAKEVLVRIAKPYYFEENKFITTASIGISIYRDHATEMKSLTKFADIAMYQSKQQGKNTFRFYTEDMETDVSAKLRLEMDLYQACDKHEFFLNYQPIMHAQSGKIMGAECLLRWEHHQLGLISPSEFIPIAEETGLIHHIGEWVLRTACHQLKDWQERCFSNMHLSVNLSPVQLMDRALVNKIKQIIEETNIDPSSLQLEITESSIIQNQEQVVAFIAELQQLGVLIAIDDFGTGYSSLNVLKELPIDTLKIDRSFLDDILYDQTEDVVLKTMFDLAKKLRLSVVAEGIETQDQLAYIRNQYCQYVQGFLFSQPLTVTQFTEFILQNKE